MRSSPLVTVVAPATVLALIAACAGSTGPVAQESTAPDSGSGAGSSGDASQGGGDGESRDTGTPDAPSPDAPSSADAGADTTPPVQYDDVSINFDELPSDTVVTSTYPTVAFASDQQGLDVLAFDPTFVGQSQPNFICAGSRCDGGFVMTFTKPVEALHFNAVGVNASDKAATIKVYESGTLTKTLDLVGKGSITTPVPIDLSSAHAITKVEVTDVTDFAGIGLDDFAFKAPR